MQNFSASYGSFKGEFTGFKYRVFLSEADEKGERKAIKFSLYYEKGRGIFLSVTPVTVGDHFESCTMLSGIDTSGFRIMAKPLERGSKKVLTMVAEHLDGQLDTWAAMFTEKGGQAAANAIRDYVAPDTAKVPA